MNLKKKFEKISVLIDKTNVLFMKTINLLVVWQCLQDLHSFDSFPLSSVSAESFSLELASAKSTILIENALTSHLGNRT